MALSQVKGLHLELFLHGVPLQVHYPNVLLHVCEDDRLENLISLALKAEHLPQVGVRAIPVLHHILPLVYQGLLHLTSGGCG
jgi:hypothetical protein